MQMAGERGNVVTFLLNCQRAARLCICCPAPAAAATATTSQLVVQKMTAICVLRVCVQSFCVIATVPNLTLRFATLNSCFFCCSDAETKLQAAEAEAATLCRWLLARAPPLDELAAALVEQPCGSSTLSSIFSGPGLAAVWPAQLQAAALPLAAEAAPDALGQLLQVRAGILGDH